VLLIAPEIIPAIRYARYGLQDEPTNTGLHFFIKQKCRARKTIDFEKFLTYTGKNRKSLQKIL